MVGINILMETKINSDFDLPKINV